MANPDSWWLASVSLGVSGPYTLEKCKVVIKSVQVNEPVYIVNGIHAETDSAPWEQIVMNAQAQKASAIPQNISGEHQIWNGKCRICGCPEKIILSPRVSGFNYHNSNWLEAKGSKCLKSHSVSSSCIVIFSNG